MGTESKDVELRIRARDDSAQSLDRLSKRIQAQGDALLKAAKRADEARAKQEAYTRSLAAQGEVSEKQQRKIDSLAAAVARADLAQEKAANRLNASNEEKVRTQDRVTAAFVAAARAAQEASDRREKELAVEERWTKLLAEQEAAQSRLNEEKREAIELERREAAEVQALRTQIEKQTEAQRRATQEFNARADAAARLVKQTEVERLWIGLLEEQDAKQARVNQLRERLAEINKRVASAQEAARAAAERDAAAQEKAAAATEKQRQAQAALQQQFKRVADEALAASRGYATLAKSVQNVRVDVLTKQIAGIVDPTKDALRSLDGVDRVILSVAEKAAKARGPLRGFRDDMQALEAAQKSLISVAGQVDAFQRQVDAVRRARTEYTQAREQVRQLADQLRSGMGSEETVKQMERAQAALRRAAQAMQEQRQKAHELREALRAAGVDTSKLAELEARLESQARQSAAAIDQLSAAHRRYGVAQERSSQGLFAWLKGERTTLSLFQRVRGELLAMTAAYVGLYGVVNLATDSIGAFRSAQAIESRLGVALGGDTTKIREEWDFLIGQADRLGFGFEKMALSYSKFSIAARNAGFNQEQTRGVFVRFAEAARVARLSTDDFEGSLRAVEQMLSKGQIQAEELRQQLGDRLPGAIAFFARGAGMSIADFTKQMEQSNITAEFVINAANEMGNVFGGPKLQTAMQSMEASLGRLDTAMFKFKLTIAEAGFADAFTDFIQELTGFLNSGDGKKLAEEISGAFTLIVKVMRFAVQNIDLVKGTFAALMAIGIVRFLFTTVTAFQGLTAAVGGMAPALRTATGSLLGLTRLHPAVAVLTAAVTGLWEIFSALPQVIDDTRDAMARMSADDTFGDRAKLSLDAFENVPLFGPMANTIKGLVFGSDDPVAEAEDLGEDIGEALNDSIADTIAGGGDLDLIAVKSVERSLKQLRERNEKADRRSRLKAGEAELDERLSVVQEEYDQLRLLAETNIKDEESRAQALLGIEQELQRALTVERRNFENTRGNNTDLAAERRKRVAMEVAQELIRIEDELRKNEVMMDPGAPFDERLKARLADVAHQYNELLRKIDRMSRSPDQAERAKAAEARAAVENYVQQLQSLEAQKVKQEELSRLEQQLNEQVSLRAATIERINVERQNGVITEQEMRDQMQQTNTVMSEGIAAAGEKLREFAITMKELMSPAAFNELMARIQTVVTQNNGAFANLNSNLEASERRLNDLMTQRSLLIGGIQQQRELGLITERQMVDQINETNGRFKENILAANQEVTTYAQTLYDLNGSPAMAELIVKMQQLKVETENTKVAYTQLHEMIVNTLVAGAQAGLDAMGESIWGLIDGTMTWKEAISNVGDAFRRVAADFLRQIAMMIIKQQILNALKNSGNPYLAAAATVIGATQSHGGGLVGMTGQHTRRVSSDWFAGAKKYHSGGMPGLNSNEVPAILEKGEEVLTRDDPRHMFNGGAGTGAEGKGSRFVLVDDRAKVPEAMASAEGDKVFLQFLSRNKATVRSVMR